MTEMANDLNDSLSKYRFGLRIAEHGTVSAVGDGIVWITGLPSASIDEVLTLGKQDQAVVFQLEDKRIGAILLQQSDDMTAGTVASHASQALTIGVGDALLGRVVDPMGVPLDGGNRIEFTERRGLDSPSPPIVVREFVNAPLYTGNKMVDTLVPIGKGQRQLIIGDNGVGKTSLALDAIINQKGKNVNCVYVAIGQKRSGVVATLDVLRQAGAMDYTAIVVAEATATPGLKYLAPFAGCAIAEFWVGEGKDTLIVYDDLTTHARAYRELSLLLRRPPGREAYPGDIFYLHSRLLERSTKYAAVHGGGSMTALPIVETEQGEIATYIPTNLISITDGQIYLDQRLFAGGFLPAIDVTRSVSRIGGNAQHPRIKQEAGRMKLDYLQFLELEVFTRFGSKLESSMEAKIKRGRVLREIFKQDRLAPISAEFQLTWMVAFNEGLFDGLSLETVRERMGLLKEHVSGSGLTLEEERARWLSAITAWMA